MGSVHVQVTLRKRNKENAKASSGIYKKNSQTKGIVIWLMFNGVWKEGKAKQG